jgi:hypothetical protein
MAVRAAVRPLRRPQGSGACGAASPTGCCVRRAPGSPAPAHRASQDASRRRDAGCARPASPVRPAPPIGVTAQQHYEMCLRVHTLGGLHDARVLVEVAELRLALRHLQQVRDQQPPIAAFGLDRNYGER